MEYLENIYDKLDDIDETNIVYYDLFDFPELFYGNLNFAFDEVNFSKFPDHILEVIKEEDDERKYNTVKKLNNSSMGCRLKFRTTSKKIILKIELENQFINIDVPIENSKGFDVYYIKDDKYIPLTIFAPENDEKIFAKCIYNDEKNDFCIFLPNYDTINKIIIGIESDSDIKQSSYIGENKKPIIFYGNRISQGILSSKNGCSYPNIVSKILDHDIINLSTMEDNLSLDIAEYIGHINCHSIILDCATFSQKNRNLEDSLEKFYKRLREFHKNIPIMLLTSPYYYKIDENNQIDDMINNIYKKAKDENTIIINQKQIINNPKQNSNDEIMYQLAKSITNSLLKVGVKNV